ncbi:MAG: GlsB/YeaQ/YmgE family stress response membrane protein [Terracidiphilus sp.]|jgi:uncharacterized membrane protein YeaQ/YmgE (transglycosylase-associated protein family)
MQNLPGGAGGVVLLILMMAFSGLVIGALARWIMPGPDPMSIGKTILLGIGGSFVGGLVASIFRLSPIDHPFWILLMEIAGALLLLALFKRFRTRTL